MSWLWLAIGIAACLTFKIAGLLVPQRMLVRPPIARFTEAVPVALLGALIFVETATTGPHLALDGRLPGLVVAAICIRLRAPFPVVIIMAAATAAVLRLVGGPE